MKNNLLLIFSILLIFLLLGCGEPTRNFKDYSEFNNDSLDNKSDTSGTDNGANKKSNNTNTSNTLSYKDCTTTVVDNNGVLRLISNNLCVEVGAGWFKKPSSSEFAIYLDKDIYNPPNIDTMDCTVDFADVTLDLGMHHDMIPLPYASVFIKDVSFYTNDTKIRIGDKIIVYLGCYTDKNHNVNGYDVMSQDAVTIFKGGGYIVLTLP